MLRNVLTVLADHQISKNNVFTEYIKSLVLTVDKIKKYAISPNTFLSKVLLIRESPDRIVITRVIIIIEMD